MRGLDRLWSHTWLGLGLLWPVVLLALPSVYDDPVRPYESLVQADTTYGDKRGVWLVPGITDTLSNDSVVFVPDPDSIGTGKAFRAVRHGDSFLVVSYDTLVASALDSAAVDSIWSDWQLGTPYAYVVTVPGQSGLLASGDLGTIYALTVQDSSDIAALVGYAYRDTMPFQNYSEIAEFDSLFEGWSEYWWDDWTGDSAGMAAWWDNTGLNNQLVDSAQSCYYTLNYHNYYDRVFSHLSYWWRTGDTSYVRKADGYADKYAQCLRDDATTAPRDFIPDGLLIRYIMSEDTLDLKALTLTTNWLERGFLTAKYWASADDCAEENPCDDARVQSRTFLAMILADAFSYPDTAADSDDWSANHADAVDSMWAWIHLGSDSAFQSGFFPLYSYCDGMTGWQMGTQWSHAMIREQEFGIGGAARSDSIDSMIVRLADTLWALGWINVDNVGGGGGGDYTAIDSFNFNYTVAMDTTDARVMLAHADEDSTSEWWWRRYDPSHTEAPTIANAVDSFWSATNSTGHVRLRDTYNSGHDSVAVNGRQYDLVCHFGTGPANAHTASIGHVRMVYSPDGLLTGMLVPIYARAWKITGDSTYWHRADSLLKGVYHSEKRSYAAWPYNNGKLYNEAYYQTMRALKWLDEG